MLISCPECGGKISDKCEICVHCGYPFAKYAKKNLKKNTCIINDKQYDLSKILDLTMELKKDHSGNEDYIISKLGNITHVKNPQSLYQEIYQNEKIPPYYYDKEPEKENKNFKKQEYKYKSSYDTGYKTSNNVRCPYCGSYDVKKITTLSRATGVATVGMASKKIGKQWHCNKCKSNF